MTNEKWENLISMVSEKFGIIEKRKEALENGPGEAEIVEFQGPLGKMKLERTTKPLVTDKKTQFSNRIGSSVTVDYVYSDTEKVHKFKAYKLDEDRGDWIEIEADSLAKF